MNVLDKRFDYKYAISHRLEIPNKFIAIKNKKIKNKTISNKMLY